MKTRTSSILTMAILAIMVVGMFTMAGVGQNPINTELKFIPKFLDTDNMATVRAEIMVYEGPEEELIRLEEEINSTTVALEGWLAPIAQWVEYQGPQNKPHKYVAVFVGSQVRSVVISKASHMGIVMPKPWNPVNIDLTVSGKLNDGRSWAASSNVKVSFSDPPGPNP